MAHIQQSICFTFLKFLFIIKHLFTLFDCHGWVVAQSSSLPLVPPQSQKKHETKLKTEMNCCHFSEIFVKVMHVTL